MSLYCNETQYHDVETAYRDITENISGSFQQFFISARRDVIRILSSWIHSRPGESAERLKIRQRYGQARHMLKFQDYTNLARAVMGEFLAESNLEDHENPLAIKTVQSGYISTHLDGLLENVRYKISQQNPGCPETRLLKEDKSSSVGPYQPLYTDKGITSIGCVLANPSAFNFNDKIVTLHDCMDFLYRNTNTVKIPEERCLGTYFKINDKGRPEYSRRPIAGSGDFRFNEKNPDKTYAHYTLKESTGYIMGARVHGMPIWAGPSFTTGRLMMMTEWVNAKPEQKKAMAWGIFAFWNQCYPHYATWIHRYHAVMDMAGNFGVCYWPFSYPRDIPPNDIQG